MKKFAFTLAEVLITLTIIGVISAMVLPNMLGHWEKKALETQTKHFYSMLQLAIHNYMADNHVDDLRDSPMHCEKYESDENDCERAREEVDKFVTKYLKVALVCKNSEPYGNKNNSCYTVTAKPFDKNSYSNAPWGPQYILAHGYAIRFNHPSNWFYPADITVDVNSSKGPNRGGRDIWSMSIFHDGSINETDLNPECLKDETKCRYAIKDIIQNRFEDCRNNQYGGGCFGHFKNNNFKFDY
jgi:prepilin-type N-terminal cleavage/methylation domain-containing protein